MTTLYQTRQIRELEQLAIDGGIDEFATMLEYANYPFLAVNLDFSNVQLQDGTPAIEIGVDGGSVVASESGNGELDAAVACAR